MNYKYQTYTVRAQDLPSPEKRPLSNISRTTSKECRQTLKEYRQFIKHKQNIDLG